MRLKTVFWVASFKAKPTSTRPGVKGKAGSSVIEMGRASGMTSCQLWQPLHPYVHTLLGDGLPLTLKVRAYMRCEMWNPIKK